MRAPRRASVLPVHVLTSLPTCVRAGPRGRSLRDEIAATDAAAQVVAGHVVRPQSRGGNRKAPHLVGRVARADARPRWQELPLLGIGQEGHGARGYSAGGAEIKAKNPASRRG